MDIYERPYYKIAKSFASLIGQWPYQSRLQRLLLESLLLNLLIIQFIPQVVSLVHNFKDLEVVLELLSAFLMDFVYFAKYSNAMLKAELIKRLFERIREDWNILKSDHEKLVLEYQLEMGKYFSIVYTGCAYMAVLVFILDPIVPIITEKVFKTNDSLPRRFAVPMEFVVCDQQKYYWFLLSLSNFCILSIVMVIVCCDVLFISFVQHACGIFSVVGFRIEHAPNVIITHGMIKESNFGSYYQDVHYRHFVTCIRDHRRALEFAELIESTFTESFGIIVGLNLPLMSITAVQIMDENNSIQDTVKNIMFTGIQMVHLFFDCYMSQRLTDMSSHIHDCIARVQWYEISARSRKLLILMTLRSQVPCKLTAAKIMDLSIRSFGMCVKTAGSYFTMLMSMR